MADFLDSMNAHRGGILLLLLCLIFLAFLAQWFAWIFSIGRFNRSQVRLSGNSLRFVFSEAAVKLINDFRHLLALVMVLIFAFALGYAMIEARTSLADMKEALQAVVATLGGLVGSIIGYYFGESTATKAQETGVATDTAQRGVPPPAVQGPSETITEAPLPPSPAT
jgi:hypothetical protein